MKKLIISLLFSIALLLFIPKQAIAVSVDLFRLSDTAYSEKWISIHKSTIYWQDKYQGIFAYDTKTKEKSLTFELGKLPPDFYSLVAYNGRYLVYNTYDSTNYGASVYDVRKNKIIPIPGESDSVSAVDFDRNTVTYIDGGGGYGDLYTFNIIRKKKTLIASGAAVPRISGRYVVWYVSTGSGVYDIRAYDLLKKQLIDIPNPNVASRKSPDVFGQKVVFVNTEGDINSVKLYDLRRRKEEVILETTEYGVSWPSISRKYIVWGKNTAQHISGVEGFSFQTREIFEVQEQGDHQNDNLSPTVVDNTAAWMAWRTGNGDIYGATFLKANKVLAKHKCIDKDGDGYARKGDNCGILDCNDKDASILPPSDGMVVTQDTTFCPGTYYLPNGISIEADDVILDCNGTEIYGDNVDVGIKTTNSNVLIENCLIRNFNFGIRIDYSEGNNLVKNNYIQEVSHSGICSTHSKTNTIKDNEISKAFFSAVLIKNNIEDKIINNEIHNNRVGFWLEESSGAYVDANNITNSESYGILIYRTTGSNVVNNNISGCGWNNAYTYLRSGITLSYTSDENNIYSNTLTDNKPYNIHLRGNNTDFPEHNSIWGNQVYTKNVSGAYEAHNIYCVDCVGNDYFDGASGPTCSSPCGN